jgi:hypothetical protein
MSSGICKNEEAIKKEEKGKTTTIFNFWIYLGIILLGVIFIVLIILIISSFFYNSNNEVNKSTTISKTTPYFETKDFNSFQQIPNITSASIPPPPIKDISMETISTNKKPFLSSLMKTTTENTDKAINSLINPLYDRKIPLKTNGGFRCKNKLRF